MKGSIKNYCIIYCLISLGLSGCGDEITTQKPNILFIVTDDQAVWTLSSESYPNTHTPELDKLASQGALMRNAFAVSVVCSPSRSALISGLYPSEVGDVYNDDKRMDTSAVIFPELFQDAG